MPDSIVKSVDIAAPVEKVWRAVTDHRQFGEWFKVALDQPFTPGGKSTGHITYPGVEGLPWLAEVVAMDEPHLFSLRWPPYGGDPDADYSAHPWLLVEFRLEPQGAGTRLTITESGFDALPPDLRDKAYRGNEEGWEIQSGNVKAYVER